MGKSAGGLNEADSVNGRPNSGSARANGIHYGSGNFGFGYSHSCRRDQGVSALQNFYSSNPTSAQITIA